MRRLGIVIVAALIAVLSVGLVTSASAGNDGSATAAAGKKKKKKKCPAGTIKKVVVKKNGKKKISCVPNAPGTGTTPGATPGASAAALSISPTPFTYPPTQHGAGESFNTFTVTNTGGTASGVPAVSITEVANPEGGNPPVAYTVSSSTCAAAVPPAGSCSITVRFGPNSNAGNQTYVSTLDVSASPGGAPQAQMTGLGL